MNEVQAELILGSSDLSADMKFFTELGFRLEQIFPSDDPAVAVMSGFGLQIRVDRDVAVVDQTINLLTDDRSLINVADDTFRSPSGTLFQVKAKSPEVDMPQIVHQFEVRKLADSAPWVIGRAGMLYRDLIPDRLGGSIIASHIRIAEGGPVPDMVHYHTIGFQLIYCYRGWVKLVYEDQGPPFILNAGDCVIQPPEIRHRVLESGDGLEVIEIGVPASHMTTIDHEMELPNAKLNPHREFGGQTFIRHIAAEATWKPWRIEGFEHRETGIVDATKGVASVHVARPLQGSGGQATQHDSDILFTFVTEGEAELHADGEASTDLAKGDAFVIPPHKYYSLENCSDNLELLEVSLPGRFTTTGR